MGLLALNLPVIGQSSATEDQKVRDALAAIQTDYNGNLTDANIAATAGIQESKIATGANGLAAGSFRAHRVAALSLPNASVVIFDNDSTAGTSWDVSSWYDTTNGRFTPQVAGYYNFSWAVTANLPIGAGKQWYTELRKNSTAVARGQVGWQTGTVLSVNTTGSSQEFANGTTDFFDVTINHDVGAATAILAASAFTFFTGCRDGRS